MNSNLFRSDNHVALTLSSRRRSIPSSNESLVCSFDNKRIERDRIKEVRWKGKTKFWVESWSSLQRMTCEFADFESLAGSWWSQTKERRIIWMLVMIGVNQVCSTRTHDWRYTKRTERKTRTTKKKKRASETRCRKNEENELCAARTSEITTDRPSISRTESNGSSFSCLLIVVLVVAFIIRLFFVRSERERERLVRAVTV